MTLATASSSTTGSRSRAVSVDLESVVKEYPGHRALDGVSLNVQSGEFVALLGPSGCGKTTALRAIAGLEGIDGGEIRFDGEDVSSTPTSQRDVGMVFQSYSLFPHLTAQENVEFGLRMRKVPAGERRSRAAEALEMVGLGERGARYAHQLSGGQQQRVALARALVTRPRVLLLDEPLSALDAKVRVQLRDQIRSIQTELGITTLFVTHDQEEALAVADRVAVMRDGSIEQIGTPEELYGQPATAFVADFIGLSNQVAGTVVGGQVALLGATLRLLDPSAAAGQVIASVRPEDVLLGAAGTGAPAIVTGTSFLGSHRRTRVILEDGTELLVQHEAELRTAVGDAVGVRLRGTPVAVRPA